MTYDNTAHTYSESNHPDVLNSPVNLTCVVVSCIKVQAPWPIVFNFIKKETPTQMFSCEICEVFQNIFLKNNCRWLMQKRSQDLRKYLRWRALQQ